MMPVNHGWERQIPMVDLVRSFQTGIMAISVPKVCSASTSSAKVPDNRLSDFDIREFAWFHARYLVRGECHWDLDFLRKSVLYEQTTFQGMAELCARGVASG